LNLKLKYNGSNVNNDVDKYTDSGKGKLRVVVQPTEKKQRRVFGKKPTEKINIK
jgi:hypothetical protein